MYDIEYHFYELDKNDKFKREITKKVFESKYYKGVAPMTYFKPKMHAFDKDDFSEKIPVMVVMIKRISTFEWKLEYGIANTNVINKVIFKSKEECISYLDKWKKKKKVTQTIENVTNSNYRIATKYVKAYIKVINTIEEKGYRVDRTFGRDNGSNELHLFIRQEPHYKDRYNLADINKVISILMNKSENRRYLEQGFMPRVRMEDKITLFEVPFQQLRGEQGRVQCELLKAFMADDGVKRLKL